MDLQKSDTWKIQLIIAINFISSKDTDEEHTIQSKSNNIEFLPYDNANGVIEERFELPLPRYQTGSETSMRRSDFIFGCSNLLYYKCHKIKFKRGGLHIDSLD